MRASCRAHLAISAFWPLWTASLMAAAFGRAEQVTFDPPAGVYDHDLAVTLSSTAPAATIYYTTDGGEPTTASAVYAGAPIAITNHVAGADDPDPADEYLPLATVSMTIKAIAVVPGGGAGEVASADFTIDKVDSTFNLPYDDPPAEGGSKHMLDVYRPHGFDHTRVLLFIHGGAWKQGDKNIYLELGNTFAGYYGITTVITNYELSADPWNAIHPEHVQDVAKAFAWVWRNISAYGGDPTRIFVFGQSAGGHLVSLLATDPSYLAAEGLGPELIRGVISMSGVYDLYDLVQFPANPLGLSALEVLEYKTLCLNTFGSWDETTLDAASPATFAHSTQPPFHLIHAWEDMAGFSAEATNFFNQVSSLNGPFVDLLRLEESDIPPEVLALDLGGHYEEIYAINTRDWSSLSTRTVVDFIGAFDASRPLRRHLRRTL